MAFNELGLSKQYDRLIILLQFITIETDKTIYNITKKELDRWLEPSLGFSEYDQRVRLLFHLRKIVANEELSASPQSGSARFRKLRELLFWRKYQKAVFSRTRKFFESISQEDILDSEHKCEPLYRAVRELYPLRDDSGVFIESDQEILSEIDRISPSHKFSSIVDIGCGKGRLLTLLSQKFPSSKLIGTSIFKFSDSEKSELIQKSILPVYCTAQKIDLPDSSQDLVVSTEVIEHIQNPDQMISEIFRILKPGGFFIVTAPCKNASMYNKNPTSYLCVAISTIFASVLPPFHNLYAPLTPIKIIHYGFDPNNFENRFLPFFKKVRLTTTRFVALRKFKLDKIARHIPILKRMGGLILVSGHKPIA